MLDARVYVDADTFDQVVPSRAFFTLTMPRQESRSSYRNGDAGIAGHRIESISWLYGTLTMFCSRMEIVFDVWKRRRRNYAVARSRCRSFGTSTRVASVQVLRTI